MSNNSRDNGREKSDSGSDRSINHDQGRSRDSDLTYSEERHKDHYVVDTLKPPPRPGRSNSDGDSNR